MGWLTAKRKHCCPRAPCAIWPGSSPRSCAGHGSGPAGGQSPRPVSVFVKGFVRALCPAPAIEVVKVLSPVRAGTGNASRFPRPRGTVPCRPVGPGGTEASARPGGCEAPAIGGAGAGRGLWAPGWSRSGAALGQGRWPLPDRRGPAEQSSVFPPAVHALGTFSAACPCPPPSATLPDWLSGTCRPHWPGVCATLSASLRRTKGAVAHRQGRNDPAPGTGKSA